MTRRKQAKLRSSSISEYQKIPKELAKIQDVVLIELQEREEKAIKPLDEDHTKRDFQMNSSSALQNYRQDNSSVHVSYLDEKSKRKITQRKGFIHKFL
jgi:hypothetical protein